MDRRIIRHIATGIVALVVTVASVAWQRPYNAIVGNLCDRTAVNPAGHCREPLPMGGFPLPYLFDRGGVSVQGALSLVEDRFEPHAFLIDWALIWLGVMLLFSIIQRITRKFGSG